MDPRVIDSLVVELGLDPSKFNAQQQAAVDKTKRTVEEIRKQSREAEDATAKVSDAIGALRTQALEMFAVFAGGKSILDFSAQLTHANAELGRTERSIGVSASVISAWQGAARIFGGDAKTMAQSFTMLSDAFAGWKIGIVSPIIADLRAISTAGGKIIDVNKGVEQSFIDLAENLKNIHDRDPAQAGLLGRHLGLDPAMIDLLIRGPAGVKEVLDYVRKIGVATHEDVDAFGELEKRMNQMGLKAEDLGRKMIGETGIAARIIALADELNKPLSEARPWDALFGWGKYAPTAGQSPASPPKLFSEPTKTGVFTSQAEKEDFIRAEAVKRGIDPDVAVRVAKSEGLADFVGDNGTSFGAFQLHVTPGGRGGAVGDQFRAATGLDLSDPANERASIQFALDNARRNGWADYHGAARVGIGNWAGIGAMTNSNSTSNSTQHIHIDKVEINAGPNADGSKIAQDFRREILNRQSYVAQGNIGQN